MSLSNYDYQKLLDNLKLISKSIKIIRDENNPDNRKFACGLTEDLVDHLYRDIREIAGVEQNDHDGHIE